MDERTFTKTVAERLRCDTRRAEGVCLTVLRALRDHLTPAESGHVAAQLPKPLQRLWLEGEHAERRPSRMHREEFINLVRHGAPLPDEAEAERAVRAVFGVLQEALGDPAGVTGEAGDVLSQLPKDLKTLWLQANRHP